jgi:hypothetical protein
VQLSGRAWREEAQFSADSWLSKAGEILSRAGIRVRGFTDAESDPVLIGLAGRIDHAVQL